MPNGNELVIRVVGDSTQFTRTISQVEAGIRRATGAASSFGHAGVTNVQAISASLRLAEGGFNGLLRAAERFIAQSQGLSAVAKAVFPFVGGVAVASIFVKMGKEAYDFVQQVNQIPAALTRGFAALDASSQTMNDKLQVTNDKLQEQIAKLEHKPVNTLAFAFDEARLHAEEFSNTLQQTIEKVNELTSKNSVNFLTAFAIPLIQGKTPQAGTQISQDFVKQQTDRLDQVRNRLTDADFNGDAAGVKQAQADLKATAADVILATQLFKTSLPLTMFNKPLRRR